MNADAGGFHRSAIRFVLFGATGPCTIRGVNDTQSTSRPQLVYWLKMLIRIVVLVLVTWGIWRTVEKGRDKFAESDFSLASLRYEWLAASGAMYLLGTFPSCVFWYRTLRAMDQRPRFAPTMRAFYVGHLGKYVPGKAMVIIIRAGMVRGCGVDTTVAATSVFVETLTMMAVAAMVAAALLALLFRQHQALMVSSLLVMAGAGLPTLPPIFQRLVRILRVHRASPAMERAIHGLSWRLVSFGWTIITIEWLLFGVSLWATLQAVPGVHAGVHDLPLLIACVCLAMIAGFLSLVPGGIGVRELVVMQLIIPRYGEVAALVAAVLLRLVWLAAELVMAGILLVVLPGTAAPSTSVDD